LAQIPKLAAVSAVLLTLGAGSRADRRPPTADRPPAPRLRPRGSTRSEAVWSHLKRSLANLTKHNLGQLTALIETRLDGAALTADLYAKSGMAG
jgi:hypothetical protein